MFAPRKGQWVKVDGRIGIYLDGSVHLVDEKGETVEIIRATDAMQPVTDVMDLPEPRRRHLPPDFDPSKER